MRRFEIFVPAVLIALAILSACSTTPDRTAAASNRQPLLIVVPVDYEGQVAGAVNVAASLREFGGGLRDCPVRIYHPKRLAESIAPHADRLAALSAETVAVEVPDEVFAYLLGAKPLTTARAEADAEGRFRNLAVVAPNTLVLAEPHAFLLPEGAVLGYSPVHHRNIGSSADEEADTFWSRLYERLEVPADAVFAVPTVADGATVRFYFNAGSFVVRPEGGLLRRWAESFASLRADEAMAEMCKEGPHNVFLHQAALAGAALKSLPRESIVELPAAYSYPLFFDRFYEADRTFATLNDVVTMRYEFSFGNLPEGWQDQIEAPPGVVSWISENCSGK